MNFTLSHCATPSEDATVQDVDSELALLKLGSDRCFGLDPAATDVCNLLAQNPRPLPACELLCPPFEEEPARRASDSLGRVVPLAEAELVEVG